MEEVRRNLKELADLFYQDCSEEGMNVFMELAPYIGRVSLFSPFINPLFDAMEQGDYILAADILVHEMAAKLPE